MKPLLLVIALVGLGFVFTLGTAAAEIENPSFETGNTNGWTQTLNGGAIEVVEVCDALNGGCVGSPFAPYDPVDGEGVRSAHCGCRK